MKRLVALVMVMSFLLLAGLGLLIYGLATKGGRSNAVMSDIVLPKGSRIEHVAAGEKNRVVLHVSEKGAEYIYFYDPSAKTQKRVAIIRE